MFSIHTKCFQELLLVFKTNRFMSVNTIDLENDEMLEGNRTLERNSSAFFSCQIFVRNRILHIYAMVICLCFLPYRIIWNQLWMI